MTLDDTEDPETKPLANGSSTEATGRFSSYPSSLVQVDLAGMSHPGLVRANNEDHYLIAQASRSLQILETNLPLEKATTNFDETAYGMLVADGLGGMAAGEVASKQALVRMMELVVQTPDWIMRLEQPLDATRVMQRMTERFRDADATLKAHAERDSSQVGMGTTLTTAISVGADLFIGHVGDSRAYLLGGRRLRQLTRDHTLSQALIDAGIVMPEDAATKKMRHVLTAALGSSTNERLDPHIQRVQLFEEDQLLLCTDGLTDMLDDKAIAKVLRSGNTAREACQTLTNMALEAGGRDNITVLLARYQFSLT